MYVEATVITGSRPFAEGGFDDWQPVVEQAGQLCAQYENGIVELANEFLHATQSDRIHDTGYLQRIGGGLPVPWALGAPNGEIDEPDEHNRYIGAGGSYCSVHLNRGRDFWNQVRRVRELFAVYEAERVPVLNNEPIGAAEAQQPGKRETSPLFFRTMGILNRLFEVGGVFHLESGLQCSPPGPTESACAAAFRDGSLLVSEDDVFDYRNVGHAGSPVQRADGLPYDRGARGYSFIAGDRGYTVLLGTDGDPRVEWGNGWHPVSTAYEEGGLQVLVIRR